MSDKPDSDRLNYQQAGVSIDRGEQLVEAIKPWCKRTQRPEMLGGLGGFGALCEIPAGYVSPVLVSGTDGVGTKLKLALKMRQLDTIGIDLVAMCVNDIVTAGAEPLFFLDYFATSYLDVNQATQVIAGIAKGCIEAGCTLAGGETAEMPGMYQQHEFDLAGFVVGVVEKSHIIDGSKVQAGDNLIALASSGPHSNGYSLIRHIIDTRQPPPSATILQQLLVPTRIYVKSILQLLKKVELHAIAHITGGGITENLPRVIPAGLVAELNYASWSLPAVFEWIQTTGNITDEEMRRTFNCGVGMILCVAAEQTDAALNHLKTAGENVWIIGHIKNE